MNPALDFMKSMREQFGEFEFRVTKDKTQVTSKGWPAGKNDPANAPESRFVVPARQHNLVEVK